MGWAQALIDQLALQGDESVLDIGCGDGKVTAELARHVPDGRVLGVDRSWAMVRLAQHSFAQVPNLAFAQMDAARLGFATGFDVAFSNATLHWVHDHRGVLDGVARALRPGGRLLFQMGGQGNAAGVVATMETLMARPAWRRYFTGFTFPYHFAAPEAFRQAMEAAGLRCERAELIEKDMQQAGAAGLAGWIRTTWLPYLERVPQEQRETFVETVVETYLAGHPLDQAGIAHVQMVRLEASGIKKAKND